MISQEKNISVFIDLSRHQFSRRGHIEYALFWKKVQEITHFLTCIMLFTHNSSLFAQFKYNFQVKFPYF